MDSLATKLDTCVLVRLNNAHVAKVDVQFNNITKLISGMKSLCKSFVLQI